MQTTQPTEMTESQLINATREAWELAGTEGAPADIHHTLNALRDECQRRGLKWRSVPADHATEWQRVQ